MITPQLVLINLSQLYFYYLVDTVVVQWRTTTSSFFLLKQEKSWMYLDQMIMKWFCGTPMEVVKYTAD